MKKLGDQFIDGLIDLVQGEKDPRNLMIIFSVVKVVLVEFDILRHVDVGHPIIHWVTVLLLIYVHGPTELVRCCICLLSDYFHPSSE